MAIGMITVLAPTLLGAARSPAASTSLVAGVKAAPKHYGCKPAQRAIRYYAGATRGWQTKRYATHLADRIPWPNCFMARRAARMWVDRAAAARRTYHAWYRHHFDWQSWLPSNWLAVGICESGQNPPNWAHESSSFVSAFGIFKPGYEDDAHRVGNLGWYETFRKLHRLPTPREQYEAAVSHYNTHGDGWGCPGP